MKKKLFALVAAFSLILANGVVTHAEVNQVESKTTVEQTLSPEAQKIVKDSNDEVQKLIANAQNKANKLDKESKNYNKKLDKIIVNLQSDAKKVTDKGISKLAELGIKAECEYIYVTIGDREEVPVDPIKVII